MMESIHFDRLKECLEGEPAPVRVEKTDHPSDDYINIIVGDRNTTGSVTITVPMEQLDIKIEGGDDWLEDA